MIASFAESNTESIFHGYSVKIKDVEQFNQFTRFESTAVQ